MELFRRFRFKTLCIGWLCWIGIQYDVEHFYCLLCDVSFSFSNSYQKRHPRTHSPAFKTTADIAMAWNSPWDRKECFFCKKLINGFVDCMECEANMRWQCWPKIMKDSLINAINVIQIPDDYCIEDLQIPHRSYQTRSSTSNCDHLIWRWKQSNVILLNTLLHHIFRIRNRNRRGCENIWVQGLPRTIRPTLHLYANSCFSILSANHNQRYHWIIYVHTQENGVDENLFPISICELLLRCDPGVIISNDYSKFIKFWNLDSPGVL